MLRFWMSFMRFRDGQQGGGGCWSSSSSEEVLLRMTSVSCFEQWRRSCGGCVYSWNRCMLSSSEDVSLMVSRGYRLC